MSEKTGKKEKKRKNHIKPKSPCEIFILLHKLGRKTNKSKVYIKNVLKSHNKCLVKTCVVNSMISWR